MNTRKLTTLLALLTFYVSNFVSAVNVPDSLDRGHKLLLEYGLQYQALVFPYSYPSGESFSMAPNTHETAAPATFGSAPGIYWARWMNWTDCEGSMNLQDWERDYIPTLVALQAGDEKDIGNSTVRNTMRDCFAHWRTNYPRAIAYTSQHGWDGASVATHQAYQSIAQPDMVNMFVYEYKDGNGVTGCTQPKWYRALGKYRHIGLLGNDGTGSRPIPSSCFYQSFIHEGNRHIGLSELSVCQYAPLLFGYKFTIAFFYNDPSPGHSDLEEELFDSDGDTQPNKYFYQASANNARIKKLGPALVRLISTKDNCYVIPGSAGVVPEYCASWNSSIDPYITSISQNNPGTRNGGNDGDVWVGYFNPLHESFDSAAYNNELYFMILNGLAQVDGFPNEAMQQITLNFDFGTSGITSLLRLNRTTGKTEVVNLSHVSGNQYTVTLEIDGGDADLFKFNDGAPFVGYIDIPENVSIAKFSGYDKPFDLTATEFFSPLGYDFSASQWQISTASSFSTVKWDSGATDAENNVTVPINIVSGGTHYGRVRYQNSAGQWSDWSDAKLLDFSSHTIAYWRFEDGVNGQKHNGDQDDWYIDISGNGNHLSSWHAGARPTATDSVPFSDVPQFKTENKFALDFVPNQDICTFNSKPINSYAFTEGWTVECSVKFKTLNSWQIPVGKAGKKGDISGWTGDDPPFSIKICGDPVWADYQKPLLNFVDNNGNVRWLWGQDILTVGKWYNFAATYDNETVKFFIKGESDSDYVLHNSISVPDGANLSQWNKEWCVGRGAWAGNAADFANAVIDEVRISDAALDVSYFLATENKKLPLLYLTNNNFTVNSSNCTIGGTNNAKVVGIMNWENSATAGSGTQTAGTSWTISGIPLAEGQNTITVSGTNVYGEISSDSVIITREDIPGDSSSWITDASGNWQDAANWHLNTIASGANQTAYFTNNITSDGFVNLNQNRTIGKIIASDPGGGPNRWSLENGGSGVLTLDNGASSPIIDVEGAGLWAMTIAVPVEGINGFTKTGTDALPFWAANNIAGTVTISEGSIDAMVDGVLKNADVVVNNGALLNFGSPCKTLSPKSITVESGGKIRATATATYTIDSPITVNGGDALCFENNALNVTNNGTITLNASTRIFNWGSGGSMVMNGAVTGTGDLDMIGQANGASQNKTYFINAQNSYSGNTYLSGFACSPVFEINGHQRFPNTDLIFRIHEWSSEDTDLFVDMNSYTQRVANLTIQPGTSGGDYIEISGNANAEIGVSGNFTIGGPGLVKLAGGKISVEGTATFNSSLAVENSVFIANGTVAGNGGLEIGYGGEVGGNGTVAGLSVKAGGKLVPGNSIGTLNAGNVEMQQGSIYDWELGDTTLHEADLINCAALTLQSIASSITVNIQKVSGSIDSADINSLFSATSINGNVNSIFLDYSESPGLVGPDHPALNGNNVVVTGLTPEPAFLGIFGLFALTFFRKL